MGRELTGERPVEGATPSGLLALHLAGYREVARALPPAGVVLDVGCGEGFAAAELVAPGRPVVGLELDPAAARRAAQRFGAAGLRVLQADGERLPVGTASCAAVVSSHVIEHFWRPERHVAELARVLEPEGVALVVTPNEPADFENPHHVHLFRAEPLRALLDRFFQEVQVVGLQGSPAVAADFARRRRRAKALLALDVFDLRHRLPRGVYLGLYERVLPLAYRLLARSGQGPTFGPEDFSVTERIDDDTLVLFATARRPRAARHGSGPVPAAVATGS